MKTDLHSLVSEKVLEKNLDLWASSHPREAVWLPYIECEHLQFCFTKNGQLNIKSRVKGKTHYHHSNVDAKKEADDWFSKQNLEGIQVLYVYGVGLGYYFQAAKKWLGDSPEHHLVFLEDDLAVIHRLFETKKGTEILKNPQTHLFYFSEISDAEVIFNELFWHFVMSKIEISCLKYYEKVKEEKFADLHHQLSYDSAIKNNLLEEYLQYGISFFHNFYANLLALPDACRGNALFGQFKNVPAVICGAGPSLQKNILLLKSLKNRAIIFAGSSSLNALSAEGIAPHLGAGIDPNPAQYERLKHTKLNFPFLYRNRIYPDALKLVKGPRLYITGSGGYDIAEWFEQQLHIEGDDIEEGANVVNFCLEIANMMGCNPIVFVGMDLAYTGMKAYTSGVVDSPTVTEKDLSEAHKLNEVSLKKSDIYGKPINTVWKWVAEAKWIGDFAEKHPEHTLINATEGGIGFPGIANTPLKQVVKKYFTRQYRIPSRLKKQIQKGEIPHVNKAKVRQAMRDLLKGLERCGGHLQVLSEENEKARRTTKKKKITEYFQTGKGALAETELSEEPAFAAVLQIFNAVYSRVLHRDLRKLNDPSGNMSEAEKALIRLDLNKRKYTFLQNVVTVNVELIKHTLNL